MRHVKKSKMNSNNKLNHLHFIVKPFRNYPPSAFSNAIALYYQGVKPFYSWILY